jgi:multicomponent Na+:H+ antiporter subunit E
MKHFSLFILSLLFWMLITFSLELGSLITGGVVALVTSLIFGRYFVRNTHLLLQPKRYFWLLVYLFIFVWECIKANIDIAYRVLHPRVPIRPGIVRVPLHLTSDFARAMLANSITMTPGTISIDIIGDDLYVHWIYISSEDPAEYTRKVSGRFEAYIKKIFE